MLEICGLQKQTLSGPLRVAGHANVISIRKWFQRIGDIFDLDVGKFGGAHPRFNSRPYCLFAFGRRIVVVVFLLIKIEMARELDAYVAFQRAVLGQAKLTSSFFQGLVRRRQPRLYPDRFFRIGDQCLLELFGPTKHAKRGIHFRRTEKLPVASYLHSDE